MLTAWIWIDLPIFVEWPARGEYYDYTGEETCDNEAESDPDWDLVATT